MAGKAENLSPMWQIPGKTLALEPAVKSVTNTYLGCNQTEIALDETIVTEKRHLFLRLLDERFRQDMAADKLAAQNAFEDAKQMTDTEAEPTKKKKSKKKKDPGPPLIDNPEVIVPCVSHTVPETHQSENTKGTQHSLFSSQNKYDGQVRAWIYDMKDHAKQCVERYVELAKQSLSSLQPRSTPCIDDHQLLPTDFTIKGTLEKVCSRIVLKILYTSRMGRPDTLWSVNTLARKVTKWDKGCDKRLHRLIEYLNSTADWGQLCFVGDHPKDCFLA